MARVSTQEALRRMRRGPPTRPTAAPTQPTTPDRDIVPSPRPRTQPGREGGRTAPPPPPAGPREGPPEGEERPFAPDPEAWEGVGGSAAASAAALGGVMGRASRSALAPTWGDVGDWLSHTPERMAAYREGAAAYSGGDPGLPQGPARRDPRGYLPEQPGAKPKVEARGKAPTEVAETYEAPAEAAVEKPKGSVAPAYEGAGVARHTVPADQIGTQPAEPKEEEEAEPAAEGAAPATTQALPGGHYVDGDILVMIAGGGMPDFEIPFETLGNAGWTGSAEEAAAWMDAFAAEHDGYYPFESPAGKYPRWEDSLEEHVAALKWGSQFAMDNQGRKPNAAEYAREWYGTRFGLARYGGTSEQLGGSPGGGWGYGFATRWYIGGDSGWGEPWYQPPQGTQARRQKESLQAYQDQLQGGVSTMPVPPPAVPIGEDEYINFPFSPGYQGPGY